MKCSGEKEAIPDGWQRVSLGEVADVAFSGVDKRTVDGELPVQLCNYTDVFYNRRIRLGMELMGATATHSERDKWTLRKGDVLFTKDSETPDEIGIPAFVVDDMPGVLCGYHLGLARPRKDIVDGAFLAEALTSEESRRQFARISNGVTRFGLTLDATKVLPILLPPLPEQRAIAAVLDGIDDAIESAEAVITATERLRDALLHDLLTRGLPGQHTEWRDVPGLGTIPADWDVVRLGDVAEVKGGKRLPKGAPFAEENTGFPYIRVVDFENRTVNTKDIRFLRAGDQRAISRYTINSADVYISIAGTIGLVGTIPDSLDGANLTENAAKIVVSRPIKLSQSCLSSYLNSLSGQSQITLRINVLGQPKLALERIRTIEVPLPPLSEQQAIASALEGVDAAIEVARKEMEGLRLLKETTADALLTGRMRISSLNSTARHWLHRQS